LVAVPEFRTVIQWLKHAFAIDPPGPAEPTAEQRPIVEKLCAEVVRRRMAVPALMLMEMSRPLNYMSAQAIQFFAPLISALTNADGHTRLAEFLERRGSVDYLCDRIEELEAERKRAAADGGIDATR
jgi:hypothetical protein